MARPLESLTPRCFADGTDEASLPGAAPPPDPPTFATVRFAEGTLPGVAPPPPPPPATPVPIAAEVAMPTTVIAPPSRATRAARAIAIAALALLLAAGGSVWLSPRAASAGPRELPAAGNRARAPRAPAAAPSDDGEPARRSGKKTVTGKLNLNTATVDELMMLPGIGLSKAERVVAWRGKHGPFRRVADLRRVKGFGYKTLKKLEAHLDVKGESTLRPGA